MNKEKNNNKEISKYDWIELIVRIVFYLFVTVPVTFYVLCNWDSVTSFTYFTVFDGKNLMLLFWIVLLLLPIVGAFEGFGVKFDFWSRIKKEKKNSVENQEDLDRLEKQKKEAEMKLENVKAGEDSQHEGQAVNNSIENQFAEATQAYNDSVKGGNDNV